MRRPIAIFGVLPLLLLAACAGMPMEAAPPSAMSAAAPAPSVAPDAARAQFIARQRTEARRQEAAGALARARQNWGYLIALAPEDDEARQQIARLDGLIRTRRDAALAQGEAAMMRGQTAAAQTAFLRVLALEGTNAQARLRLLELETRAAFARQDRKDARARAARMTGTESPEDEQ
jgi:hypothetical protein